MHDMIDLYVVSVVVRALCYAGAAWMLRHGGLVVRCLALLFTINSVKLVTLGLASPPVSSLSGGMIVAESLFLLPFTWLVWASRIDCAD